MLLRTFILRLLVFALPGILILAGGRSPTQAAKAHPTSMGDLVANALYPDNWGALVVCAVLICMPGVLIYAGADYLAEVTFWRGIPLEKTPAIIWRITGYVVTLGAALLALQRLVPS